MSTVSQSIKELTPTEAVLSRFDVPFPPYPFQRSDIDRLAPEPKTGLYYDPGLGKTSTATLCALYKFLTGETNVVIVVVPPVIIHGWCRYLKSIKAKNGAEVNVVAYKGTPAERKKLDLSKAHFVVLSMAIFKKEHEAVVAKLKANARIHLIVDEAHCLKDVGTANYKTVRDFAMDRTLQLLTGTPMNKPEDAYAYTKLIAPHLYRNLNDFNMLHVVEVDFYKKPCKYGNLDMLQANFKVNAARATKEEVLVHLPPLTIQVMEYDLASAHLKLYRQLVEQKLLEYDDGTKLDATQAGALWHALGQIVMNWGHFAQDEDLLSAGFEVLDEVLDELGDRKLVVFSHYKMTNRLIRERYKCASVYSEITDKQKEIDRFINDPKCRIINMQPGSGGVGVDGLQHVCSDVLYLEPPITPSHLTQSLSRVYREGQKLAVTVRLAQAIGTGQRHAIKQLTAKEAFIAPLQGSKAALKAAFFGED